MKDYTEELFNHKILRPKLITIALFIAVYENFKMTIVDTVKSFFINGCDDKEFTYEGYEEKVLNKVPKGTEPRQVLATLLWFKEHDAIDDKDIETCKKISGIRNRLVHNMTDYIYEGLPENISVSYLEMIALFKKIMKWWINEIEIPISGEYLPGEYDPEQVSNLNVNFLEIITDIAINENEEYMKMYKEMKENNKI
jgi:hypothetical protein